MIDKIKEYLNENIRKNNQASKENESENNLLLKNYFTGKEAALIQVKNYIEEIEEQNKVEKFQEENKND